MLYIEEIIKVLSVDIYSLYNYKALLYNIYSGLYIICKFISIK